jgi:hypothetical protein
VAGYTPKEIGKKVALSPSRLNAIRRSPDYVALREQLSTAVSSQRVFDIKRAFDDEAASTFRRFLELRDQDDDLGVAARMIAEHLDRIAPKRTAVDVDSSIHLRLSVEQMAAMRIAAAEDDGLPSEAIDVTAVRVPDDEKAA